MLELKQANDQLIYLKDMDFCEDSHIALMSILEDYELLQFEARNLNSIRTGTLMKEFNRVIDQMVHENTVYCVKILLKRK